ncbi:DUF805 domain-containing protein [Enterococcus faecalis]|nr:DUF805 domain-containing protein [Enterococcus faecalis]
MKNIFDLNKGLSRRKYWYYQCKLFVFGLGIETFSMLLYEKSLLENNYLKYFVINGPFDFYNFLRIVFFIMIIIGFLFQSRRFVDIGWSKFVALLSLLPLVGIITTGICLFKKGKENKTDSSQVS